MDEHDAMDAEAIEFLSGEILKNARHLLQRGWCQGPMALDANGEDVGVHSPAACSFCSLGAIRRASWDMDLPISVNIRAADRAIERLADDIHGLISWNERKERTQEEILRGFDRAIGGK